MGHRICSVSCADHELPASAGDDSFFFNAWESRGFGTDRRCAPDPVCLQSGHWQREVLEGRAWNGSRTGDSENMPGLPGAVSLLFDIHWCSRTVDHLGAEKEPIFLVHRQRNNRHTICSC